MARSISAHFFRAPSVKVSSASSGVPGVIEKSFAPAGSPVTVFTPSSAVCLRSLTVPSVSTVVKIAFAAEPAYRGSPARSPTKTSNDDSVLRFRCWIPQRPSKTR
ncbi:hypothetical protein [Streptomyces sp. H72]